MLNTFIKYVGRIGQTLFSLTLWMIGFLFLAAGFAVLMHQGLSNWNAIPHLVLGVCFLVIAVRRFAYRWSNAGRFGLATRTLVLLAIVAGISFGIDWTRDTLTEFDDIYGPGEFSDVIGEHDLNVVWWSFQANVEDFAEFSTLWASQAQLNDAEGRAVVQAYFYHLERGRHLERKSDREGLSVEEQEGLAHHKEQRQELQRTTERIISRETDAVFDELGLRIPWGQRILLAIQQSDFRFASRLNVLVTAERDTLEIYRSANIEAELLLKDRDAIEAAVTELGYSAYVHEPGGIPSFPNTIVPRSPQHTLHTIAHERIHVWFFFTANRDYADPEQLVIEETSANLLGDAIGEIVYCRFYDDPDVCEPKEEATAPVSTEPDPDKFDHRAALRDTYLTAETMLAEDRIEEAEVYMEERRQWMCEMGYCLRVLNQAFFAISGNYADNSTFEDTHCRLGAKIQELWSRTGAQGKIGEFFRIMTNIQTREELEIVLYGEIDGTCNS